MSFLSSRRPVALRERDDKFSLDSRLLVNDFSAESDPLPVESISHTFGIMQLRKLRCAYTEA